MIKNRTEAQQLHFDAQFQNGPYADSLPSSFAKTGTKKKFAIFLKEVVDAKVTYSWFSGRKWTLSSTGSIQYSLNELYQKAESELNSAQFSRDEKFKNHVVDFAFKGYEGNAYDPLLVRKYTLKDLEDSFVFFENAYAKTLKSDWHKTSSDQLKFLFSQLDAQSDLVMKKERSIIFRIHLFLLRCIRNGFDCDRQWQKKSYYHDKNAQNQLHVLSKVVKILPVLLIKQGDCFVKKEMIGISVDFELKSDLEHAKFKLQNLKCMLENQKSIQNAAIYLNEQGIPHQLNSEEQEEYLQNLQREIESDDLKPEWIKQQYDKYAQLLKEEEKNISLLKQKVEKLIDKLLPRSSGLSRSLAPQVKKFSEYVILKEGEKETQFPDLKIALDTGDLKKAFGLQEGFNKQELESAARKMFLKAHWDKHPDLDPGYFHAFQAIKEALSAQFN